MDYLKHRKGTPTRRITKADIESVRNALNSDDSVTQELLDERKKDKKREEKNLKGVDHVVSHT